MHTPPSQLPFDAPLKRAPATLEPFLRPVLRGIAIEDISSVAARGPDVGATTLETVENLSPIQNTPENTRENTRATPAGEGERGALGRAVTDTVGPARARDAALLLLIVRLRIASIQQLAQAAFPNVSIVVARRRLRALQQGGWLRAWDRPVASGGAPRYLYPTAKALRWAYPLLVEQARGTAAEEIVRLMIPDSTKRLVQLEGGWEPQWFAHQDEINRLLLSRSRVEGDALLWASSWDCPFPDRLNGLKSPQPDYVLVTARDGKASLTFGEHDRATEPMARWMEKLAAYAAAREVAEDLFGHAEFTVDVTVTDPLRRAPHRRVREIVNTVRAAECHGFVRVTLGGWANAFPLGRIWFAEGNAPTHDALKPDAHSNIAASLLRQRSLLEVRDSPLR
jgi:hypothetical protein